LTRLQSIIPDRIRTGRLAKRHSLLVRKHLIRNYVCHALEGGLYIGGLKFRAADTVLPVMVAALGGQPWLIGLVPILGIVGWVLPPLFVAHRVQRMAYHMPLVLVTGVFQRLPFLGAGLALIFLARDFPKLALGALAACPLLSGLMGGFGLTAWQVLVANTIPPNRRSSLWAVRNILTASIGLIAGGTVAGVIGFYGEGNPTGYGALHLIAFGFLVISYVAFASLRETPYPGQHTVPALSLSQNFRQMPGLIRRDRRLGLFLTHRILIAGTYLVVPFLSLHALTTLGKPEAFVGTLLAAQMSGVITGNILAGLLGDRFGGKTAATAGSIALLCAYLWSAFASTSWEFWANYYLIGLGWSMYEVGRIVLSLEISPVKARASYLALMSGILAPTMLTASWISSTVWTCSGKDFAWVGGIAVIAVASSLALLFPVKEPRYDRPQDEPEGP